ncbi:MAG: iron-sulfur cluster assembly protein [Rhodospirillales bacterium]|nr:iron-sulfur cluster assembly protein [Rhodospirillales bacterium]MYD96583.1 DUF59 domain-containing protein [Gammaproteobacteria bacterium]MCY4003263.1 iron-sulfur cluster assembly protein [Rhodospirillales bacterium]MCY4098555.1 iron-sulfur cluster assembly protein [Rhodospirillales bacterium]MDE0371805.1 iron-sulfur cluster assembly protein [Rhodospirillales bacterium]
MAHFDTPPQPGTVTPDERAEALRPAIVAAIGTVYDPEIPVSIWELGLVYDIAIRNGRDVDVTMTLTTPHCPEAQYIPGRVEEAVREVSGVGDVRVDIVWEPPWTPDRMSEAARLELGYF